MARSTAEREYGEVKRGGAAGDGEGVTRAAVCGELLLELRYSWSGAPPARSNRVADRGKELLIDPQVRQRYLPPDVGRFRSSLH